MTRVPAAIRMMQIVERAQRSLDALIWLTERAAEGDFACTAGASEGVPMTTHNLEAENARLRAAWKIAEPHLPELKYRQALAALRELRDMATDICARVELGGQP